MLLHDRVSVVAVLVAVVFYKKVDALRTQPTVNTTPSTDFPPGTIKIKIKPTADSEESAGSSLPVVHPCDLVTVVPGPFRSDARLLFDGTNQSLWCVDAGDVRQSPDGLCTQSFRDVESPERPDVSVFHHVPNTYQHPASVNGRIHNFRERVDAANNKRVYAVDHWMPFTSRVLAYNRFTDNRSVPCYPFDNTTSVLSVGIAVTHKLFSDPSFGNSSVPRTVSVVGQLLTTINVLMRAQLNLVLEIGVLIIGGSTVDDTHWGHDSAGCDSQQYTQLDSFTLAVNGFPQQALWHLMDVECPHKGRGNLLGLAWVGELCDQHGYNAAVSYWSPKIVHPRVFWTIAAHEIGRECCQTDLCSESCLCC